mgnify:FL=1|tara:strand:- start:6797 stop:7177 length:381 start_codon:yes stop_codon:yes gene_type:complete
MNIPTYLLGAIIFLIGQTTGAIWWASSLSAEVERLSGIQGDAIPALEAEAVKCGTAIHDQGQQIERIKELTAETSGLDVLAFKVEELRKEISGLREVDKDIMTQHERIFQWMANANPSQTKGNPYD